MVRFYTGRELIPGGKGKWKTNCPTADHDDQNPSFEINDNLGHFGAYKCWGCQVHGGGEDFAQKIMRKKSWQAAVNDYVAVNRNGAFRAEPVNRLWRPRTAAPSVAISDREARTRPASPEMSEEDILIRLAEHHYMQQNVELASQLFQDSLLNDRVVEASGKEPLNKKAREYLSQRGLWKPDPAFKVGYFPAESFVKYLDKEDVTKRDAISSHRMFAAYSYLRGRIIFPWCNDKGDVVGLTGRSIGDPPKGKPKYWNSKNTDIFKKSELLWGHHLAKEAIRKTRELIVVEGYTDVMSLHKAGIKQTVSPIGIAISRTQLDKLFSLNDHVLVCLDGDKAGRKASVDVAKHTLAYLNETGSGEKGKSMSFALLPGGKDPDEILREGGVQAFERAISKRLSLTEMIAYGEELERQNSAAQMTTSSSQLTNGTAGQSAPEAPRTISKRDAPDARERARFEVKRQRGSGGLEI
ncbi:toprim domain-containing protein [Rhizobium sp. NFACC06-2]|uniref:toprim domain-containing protein n=1 Tax=Rhizobium sp. NFACC06-2 TaxID=1566264 RepID=UPI00165ED0AF|nr:toprim domain-containing protein [Rhizobium sp. NFACC06-2]